MDHATTFTARVCVRRLLSVLGNGATIFNGTDEAGNPIRVVAPPQALARVPVAGEWWVVEGIFRDDGVFGAQFHATGGRYELPRGRLLTRYLAEHPDFTGIGETKAKRLWDAFGERLHLVLSQGQIEVLGAILSPSAARRLVDIWAEKREEAETVEFLDVRIPANVITHFGGS